MAPFRQDPKILVGINTGTGEQKLYSRYKMDAYFDGIKRGLDRDAALREASEIARNRVADFRAAQTKARLEGDSWID
jgi:hypothetical protein